MKCIEYLLGLELYPRLNGKWKGCIVRRYGNGFWDGTGWHMPGISTEKQVTGIGKLGMASECHSMAQEGKSKINDQRVFIQCSGLFFKLLL